MHPSLVLADFPILTSTPGDLGACCLEFSACNAHPALSCPPIQWSLLIWPVLPHSAPCPRPDQKKFPALLPQLGVALHDIMKPF
jgi:hypothetical protein